MPTFSEITIKFLTDFEEDYALKITLDTITYEFDWVTARSGAGEVTTGTPTGNAGETTAINFEAAFDLDVPSGFITTIQNTNEVLIQSETEGLDFRGVRAVDNNENNLILGTDYDVIFNNFEPVIDISNVQFAMVRSPHYISTPFNFESTTKATIKLYVWNGDLASVPSEPTYQLTKIRPTINYQEFNTNISNQVLDQLDGKPNIQVISTTQIVDSANEEIKWFKWVASYTDDVETIPDIEDTLIATEGYGYYLEGVNPTKPSNNILTSSTLRKVSRDGFIILPFFNNGEISDINIDSDGGEINENEVLTATDNSNKAVQYLMVDVSQATTDTYIEVTFNPGGDVITYEVIDECRYDPKQIVFKNKFGLYDSLTLFKKNNNSISAKNDDFTNSYISGGTYSTTDHQRQKINIQGEETITCNSGYVNEKENELYKELMLSDKVFFYESGVLIPVNVMSNSLEFKTRVNDGLINYTIEFKYAYNLIQNV